jgi:hypothetical protein
VGEWVRQRDGLKIEALTIPPTSALLFDQSNGFALNAKETDVFSLVY